MTHPKSYDFTFSVVVFPHTSLRFVCFRQEHHLRHASAPSLGRVRLRVHRASPPPRARARVQPVPRALGPSGNAGVFRERGSRSEGKSVAYLHLSRPLRRGNERVLCVRRDVPHPSPSRSWYPPRPTRNRHRRGDSPSRGQSRRHRERSVAKPPLPRRIQEK